MITQDRRQRQDTGHAVAGDCMKIRDIITEYVTPADLRAIGDAADSLWNKLGVNIAFSHHFLQRANERDLDPDDLNQMFTKQYHNNGEQIIKHRAVQGKKDPEGVMVDLSTNLNVPFAMHDHGRRGKDLVAATGMVKKNYHTPDKKFIVK